MGDDKEGTLPPSSEVKRTSPPFRPDPDLIKFLEGGRPGQRKGALALEGSQAPRTSSVASDGAHPEPAALAASWTLAVAVDVSPAPSDPRSCRSPGRAWTSPSP